MKKISVLLIILIWCLACKKKVQPAPPKPNLVDNFSGTYVGTNTLHDTLVISLTKSTPDRNDYKFVGIDTMINREFGQGTSIYTSSAGFCEPNSSANISSSPIYVISSCALNTNESDGKPFIRIYTTSFNPNKYCINYESTRPDFSRVLTKIK